MKYAKTMLAAGAAVALTATASILVGAQGAQPTMSFFITSTNPGKGADFGGLDGADKHCQALAQAAGAGTRTWRAYLSTAAADGKPGVNARDRIGSGPWYNVKGVKVADTVADLHSDANKLSKENSLNEKGEGVNGRGDTPNRHDLLTGSQLDGTAFPAGGTDLTCNNWTSSTTGAAQTGHHDRTGGGQNPTSWNSAHATKGCATDVLRSTGGEGYFYCFAAK